METVRFENTKYGFLLYGEEDGVWKVEEGREIFTFLSFKSYLGEGEDLQFAMHGGGWSVIIVGLDGRYGWRKREVGEGRGFKLMLWVFIGDRRWKI